MSVFRPMNSDESNLFSIRLNLPEISSSDLDGSTKLVKDVVYVSPSKNNLPVGFSLKFDSGNSLFTLTYGKTFTTVPSLNINFYHSESTHIEIVTSTKTECTFYLYKGVDGMNNPTKLTSTPIPQSSFLILGSTKLGLTTGNSNKGWQIESGSNPNSVFTHMNVGIGKGNPTSSLEIVDTSTANNSVNIKSDSLTTGSALNISSISTDQSERDLVKITNTLSNDNLTLMNINGSDSKYALKLNGNVKFGTNPENKIELPYGEVSQTGNLATNVNLDATAGTILLHDSTLSSTSPDNTKTFTVTNSLCNVNTHIHTTFLYNSVNNNSHILCNVTNQVNGSFNIKLTNIGSTYNCGYQLSKVKFLLFNGNIEYTTPLFSIQPLSNTTNMTVVLQNLNTGITVNTITYNWEYTRDSGNSWNNYNPVLTTQSASKTTLRAGPSMTTRRLHNTTDGVMYMFDQNNLPTGWTVSGNDNDGWELTDPNGNELTESNTIVYSNKTWKISESTMTVRVTGTYNEDGTQKNYTTDSFVVTSTT